jgi:hypothetical protein
MLTSFSAKLTHVAIERSAQKRAEYVYKIGLYYTADQLVFVDESSFDRRTTYRGKAWAIQGQRAIRKAFFVRGKRCAFSYFELLLLTFWNRYSILPAISLDGMLSVSIVEGSFNKFSFADFIEGVLDQMNPFPGTKSVVIMDNCRIHKAPWILDMITAG